MTDVSIPGVPFPLGWLGEPAGWDISEGGALVITAGPRTDRFIDPGGDRATLDAPGLVGPAEGDFQLSALVEVGFRSTYDAGVLFLHADDRTWAKLCFEYSPQGRPMVVSVVTRGVSDDCNSFEVDGAAVWLRISRVGAAFAFHASTDGATWQFIRHFALIAGAEPQVGVLAQSPTGDGCTATFRSIRFAATRLQDLRNGE